MKVMLTMVTVLLIAACAVIGWGTNLHFANEKKYGSLQQECQTVRKDRDGLRKRAESLQQECQSIIEDRNALRKRVEMQELAIKKLNDGAARNEHAPQIAAFKLAKALQSARGDVTAATTSLSREKAENSYRELVNMSKGKRVIIRGKIKNVGRRLVSFSEMYVTLTVEKGFDVKFIFEKAAEKELLAMEAGQDMTFEGYVVSAGDLLHQLTIGGATKVEAAEYDEVVRLAK